MWNKFGDYLRWRNQDGWFSYNDLYSDIFHSTAQGYFPHFFLKIAEIGDIDVTIILFHFFSRLENCRV